MPGTYFPVASTTLSSTSSNVVFSSIPQTYTDLRVIISASSSTGASYLVATFNADTNDLYSITDLRGGFGAISSSRTITTVEGNYLSPAYGSSVTQPQNIIWDIFSYASATVAKSSLVRMGVMKTSEGVNVLADLWRSTAPITSIEINVIGGALAIGSVLSIYGIKAA